MADLQKIAEDLSSLSVIEANELSKILEKWGVSAKKKKTSSGFRCWRWRCCSSRRS